MKSTKQHLTELYFKAVGEKEVAKRTIEKSHELNEPLLIEYTQLSNLISNLRDILGSGIVSVP